MLLLMTTTTCPIGNAGPPDRTYRDRIVTAAVPGAP